MKDFRSSIATALDRLKGRTYYEMWIGSVRKRHGNPIDELVGKLEDQGTCPGRLLGIQKQLYQQRSQHPDTAIQAANSQDSTAFAVLRTIYTMAFEATVLHELSTPFPNFDYRGLKEQLRNEYYEDIDNLLQVAQLAKLAELSVTLDHFTDTGADRIEELIQGVTSELTTVYINVLHSSGAAVSTLLTTTAPNYFLFDLRFPGSLVPGTNENGGFPSLELLIKSSLSYIKKVYLANSIDTQSPIFIQISVYTPAP